MYLGHLGGLSVKQPALGLGSDHDLRVCFVGLGPASGSVLTVQSLLGILSLPLSPPLPHSLSGSLSLKINKLNLKKKKIDGGITN